MKHIKRYSQLFESTQELTQEQRDWLDKCTKVTWEVNPQTGLVDVSGSFECPQQNLTDFKGVRFGRVSRDFNCSRNMLTSLEGAPQSVGGDFDCGRNMLTSLKGAPQKVRFDFDLSHNQLTSLEGAPQSVGGYLHCSGNPISSAAITNVLSRMSGSNFSLEGAVSYRWKTGGWDEIPEEDKPYLAKHNPDLSPDEKREYAALERLKGRVI